MAPRRDAAPRFKAALAGALLAALSCAPAPALALARSPAEAAAAAAVSVQAVEPTPDGRAKVAECSGALVAENLVLTSGHCLDGASGPSRVAVFVYRDGRPVPKPMVAAAIARHPDHVVGWREKAGDPGTRQREIASDLALIRLAEPVAGATPFDVGAGEGGAIAGAGASAPGGRSGVMKSAALSAVRASTGAGARVVFATSAKTVCGGDSGGPAVGLGANGAPVLWGVISAVLKPKGGCGTRIAVTPVDAGSAGFQAMKAAVGAR